MDCNEIKRGNEMCRCVGGGLAIVYCMGVFVELGIS